jgi:hypothetical protein
MNLKRLIAPLTGLLLFLSAAPTAWACPECRARVNSGVYSSDFTGTLIVMLLPIIVLALIGVGVYYADAIKAKFKGGTGKWQTTEHALR